MLKGHVFSKQLFENQIFALFINTFLNGENGVSDNYLNGMEITYSGSNITVSSGAVCIQGRFIEEDNFTTLNAGTSNLYNKLVIEVDLDKQNTETALNQVSYKIITSGSSYPKLTQTDIVKNNAGIYQYELARFRTDMNGITDFQDMRTFLNFESIYQRIQADYKSVLEQLEEELANVENGSAYVLKNNIAVLTKNIIATPHNTTNADFDFPDGFTKSNCICISYNFRHDDSGAESYGDYELYAIQHLNIYSSGITYALQNNSDNDIDATVRVVLMKIQ